MALDQAWLEGLRSALWLLFPVAVALAAISAAVTRRRCIARVLAALVLAAAAMAVIEAAQAAPLSWWQQFGIDFVAFTVITLPPRHYWQSTMGALVFAQLVMHALLWAQPDLARWHWLVVTAIEFAKCAVLIAWAGGKRVEIALGRAARFPARLAARLVPAAAEGKLAR